MNKNTAGLSTVAAIFDNRADAQNAIMELKEKGFTSSQIRCNPELLEFDASDSSQSEAEHRSFWQKIGDFFSGEDHQHTTAGATAQSYAGSFEAGENFVSVEDPSRIEEAEEVLSSNDGEIVRDLEAAEGPELVEGAERPAVQQIQLLSEMLKIHKDRVSTGEVQLRKEVITETQNVQVPVTREELVIERVPTQGETVATGSIGSDSVIRVPLSEEKVRVEKKPIVREEVSVGKRSITETETVSEQTQREELRVDDENVKKRGTQKDKKIA